MPSPFPGMDPWLEGDVWSSFHYELCSAIARQLSPKLLPKYFAVPARLNRWQANAEIEVGSGVGTVPDVGVHPTGRRGQPAPSATAVLTPPAMTAHTMIVGERVPHFRTEVRDVKDRRLIAMIEVMSPWNKRIPGRDQYLAKRVRVLESLVHLLEIDLIRGGRRIPTRETLPPTPYFVFLNRGRRRSRSMTDVWPIGLKDPLPTVPVPLRRPDPDVPLDIQAALTTAYDALGFRYIIDYGRPAEPAMSAEDEAWADERLRTAGIRSEKAS